jgi:hypothetical protein
LQTRRWRELDSNHQSHYVQRPRLGGAFGLADRIEVAAASTFSPIGAIRAQPRTVFVEV